MNNSVASCYVYNCINSTDTGGIIMANSELSKLKILYLYDYFKHNMSSFDDEGVTVSELIEYLQQKLNNTFERKSIYADISKINEYVSRTQKVKSGSAWIYVEGKKYRKSELEDEITIDEARLIVDAINTTPFTSTSICSKIKTMFPKYFVNDCSARALYPHDGKIDHKRIMWLNNFRNAIENSRALEISYGYKLGNELMEVSTKYVSPMALDWENNCYYLIAVDNEIAGKLDSNMLAKALRRYRLDRVDKVVIAKKKPFFGFASDIMRDEALKALLDNSLSAYSSDSVVNLSILIKGRSAIDTLKAYNAFATRVRPAENIDDTRLGSRGELKLEFRVADVPTLYTDLFEIMTFEGVELKIENDSIREKFNQYLTKAMNTISSLS